MKADSETLGGGVTLHPASLDDADALQALCQAVGWPHRAVDLRILVELGQGHVARNQDGQVMAVGLWWSFGSQAARIGMVIVSPALQGLGIGRYLMDRLLAETGSRSVMLLATDAGRPLYEKLGFHEIGSVHQRQGQYEPKAAADGRVRRAMADDRGALLACDAAAFGVERVGTLEHLMAIGKTFVLMEEGELRGYAIDRAFGRGRLVGPIVAASEADAIALFRGAARPGFVRVDIPAEADVLSGHLEDCGLAMVDKECVMLRGDWALPTEGVRVFGLASHALG